MRFWDSSAVLPLLVVESTSAAATQLFESDPMMLVWWASEVECASALCRLERDGILTGRALRSASERLDAVAGAWHEVQPVEAVRRAAKRLLRTHPLRAADALQLAAALVASEGDPATMEMVSLDRRVIEAAGREGLAVVTPAARG